MNTHGLKPRRSISSRHAFDSVGLPTYIDIFPPWQTWKGNEIGRIMDGTEFSLCTGALVSKQGSGSSAGEFAVAVVTAMELGEEGV